MKRPNEAVLQKLMVQLQIFTTSDYLQKKSNIFDDNKKRNRKKKFEIFFPFKIW